MMKARCLIVVPLFFLFSFGLNADNLEGEGQQSEQGNMQIEIYHCTSCGFRTRANALADEIQREFDVQANLVVGAIGSFDVYLNGDLIFSKAEAGRFPNPDEIIQNIREYENKAEMSSVKAK
jgi:selenoprotein W-related protein